MVTPGILSFRENSHDRAGNSTRDLMINSQSLWQLDHEAGLSIHCKFVHLWVYNWRSSSVCTVAGRLQITVLLVGKNEFAGSEF